MKITVKALFISFLALTTLLNVSCRKKKDTIAKIYVVDEDNNRVPGASVTLKGVSTENNSPAVVPPKTATTNSTGEATFDFNEEYQKGQAGVAVLNIEVTYEGLSGQGIIKIVEEETNEETVFIQ